MIGSDCRCPGCGTCDAAASIKPLKKSLTDSRNKYDELFRMMETYIAKLHAAEKELAEHKTNAITATQLLVEARRDFVLVADALGLVSTDDTGKIGAVAPVEDVVAEAKQAASALARQSELFESMRMACEEPPPKCECAGCMYAREKAEEWRQQNDRIPSSEQ